MDAIRKGLAQPATVEYAQLEREEFSDGSQAWNVLIWWEYNEERCEVQRIACNSGPNARAVLEALKSHTGMLVLSTVKRTPYPR